MALLKDDKKKIAKQYQEVLSKWKNVVVLSYQWIPVNEMNEMRMWLAEAQWVLQVVKKRVFLKSIEGAYEWLSFDQLEWSIAVLVSENEDDEHAPLKVIYKQSKKWKKDKEEYSIGYVWWWYDEKDRKDASYVAELAALPSKEELVGKLLFMLNHPVSSFARVLNAIAEKDGDGVVWDAEQSKEEGTQEESETESSEVESQQQESEQEEKEESQE